MPNPQRDDENVIGFNKRAAEIKRMNQPKPDPEEEKRRTRSNVAALVFAALLVGLGWLLVKTLGENSKREDCLLSGRTNCSPIAMPQPE